MTMIGVSTKHPLQSPSLHVIEKIWRILKLHIQPRKPNNLAETKMACREEWATIGLIVLYCRHFKL